MQRSGRDREHDLELCRIRNKIKDEQYNAHLVRRFAFISYVANYI